MSSTIEKHVDILACPACLGNLKVSQASFKCRSCHRQYPVVNDVPDFAPEVTRRVGRGQQLMVSPFVPAIYEHFLRPALTRIGSAISYVAVWSEACFHGKETVQRYVYLAGGIV